MSIQVAVEQTRLTIERRLRQYRNMVVVIVLVPICSLVWALIQGSWLPLLGTLAIIPVIYLLLMLDTRQVHLWQLKILERWQQEQLSLDVFIQTVTQIRYLPQATLKGMLETLPVCRHSSGKTSVNAGTRRAAVLTIKTIQQCQYDRQVWVLLANSYALVVLSIAIALRTWIPLSGIIVLLLVPIFYVGQRKWKFRRWEKQLLEVGKEIDVPCFTELTEGFNWGFLSKTARDHILTRLDQLQPSG